jgi:hypothetical protein
MAFEEFNWDGAHGRMGIAANRGVASIVKKQKLLLRAAGKTAERACQSMSESRSGSVLDFTGIENDRLDEEEHIGMHLVIPCQQRAAVPSHHIARTLADRQEMGSRWRNGKMSEDGPMVSIKGLRPAPNADSVL